MQDFNLSAFIREALMKLPDYSGSSADIVRVVTPHVPADRLKNGLTVAKLVGRALSIMVRGQTKILSQIGDRKPYTYRLLRLPKIYGLETPEQRRQRHVRERRDRRREASALAREERARQEALNPPTPEPKPERGPNLRQIIRAQNAEKRVRKKAEKEAAEARRKADWEAELRAREERRQQREADRAERQNRKQATKDAKTVTKPERPQKRIHRIQMSTKGSAERRGTAPKPPRVQEPVPTLDVEAFMRAHPDKVQILKPWDNTTPLKKDLEMQAREKSRAA